MTNPDNTEIEAIFSDHLHHLRWQEAMSTLVEAYGDEVLRFLNGFLRDAQNAEEVFALLCLRLCEDIERFRGECSGRTWFFYKARFMALDWRRSLERARERRLETGEMSRMEQLVAQVRSRTRPYLRTDVKDRFSVLRKQLDSEEHMLLVLYKYQNMSSQQVAEAMSSPEDVWTPQKVRKRWQRLKIKITELATSQGLLDA